MNKYTADYIVERSELISSILFTSMKNYTMFANSSKNEEAVLVYECGNITYPSTVYSELNKLENIKSVLSHSNIAFMKTVLPAELTGFEVTRLLEDTRVDEDMIIKRVDDTYEDIESDKSTLFKNPDNITRFNIPVIDRHECPKEVIHGQNAVEEAKKVVTAFECVIDNLILKCREVSKHFSTSVGTINDNIDKALQDTLYSNMLTAELEACKFITKDAVQSQIISIKLESELEKLANARAILMEAFMYDPYNRMESLEIGRYFGDMEYRRVIELAEYAYSDENVKLYEETIAFNEKLISITESLNDTNQKVLDKYEKIALASSCAGIYIDKYYIPKDIKKILEKARTETIKDINKTIDSWNRMSVGKREFTRLATLFKASFKSNIGMISSANFEMYEIKKNYKLSPKDVKDAIAVLKTAPDEIKKCSKDIMSTISSVSRDSLNEIITAQLAMIPLASDLNSYKKAAVKTFNAVIDDYYNEFRIQQLQKLQKQAKKVLILVSRDKNVNESMINRFKSDDEKINLLIESMGNRLAELEYSLNESQSEYAEYMVTGDLSLLKNQPSSTVYKITPGLPSCVDRTELEDKADNLGKKIYHDYWNSNKLYKSNPKVQRFSPFGTFETLDTMYLGNGLDSIVFDKISGLDRAMAKVHQYNFTRDKRKYSILILSSRNKLYGAYFIINGELNKKIM